MAWVKDRLPGNAIVTRIPSRVLGKRVWPRTPTIVHCEMTTHIGVLPTDILDAVADQSQDQLRFVRLLHPRTGT